MLTAALFATIPATARKDFNPGLLDSVEVSLLTCQPHDEIYSLYGHTAIRWHDLRSGGDDLAFNYGVFNFNAPLFIGRFVFGLTDYELGVYPYQLFQREYRHFGSMVTEQVLNLTLEEKQKLFYALADNLLPDNRIYRYNYFYNNCTTKARDIIEQCVKGKMEYTRQEDGTPTYREMIHAMTQNHPWARFGNDMLLGIKADRATTRRQQEFLPANLMADFDLAQVYDNGAYRPLVKERRIAVPAGVQMTTEGFPLSPLECAILIGAIGLTLFVYEKWKVGHAFLLWDVLLMIVTGIIGIVLFLMLFSQHPTVSLNLQIILLNPIHLFFLPAVISRRSTRYWQLTATLAIGFLIGGLFQHYAEGIQVLALCLLLQSYIHLSQKTR